MIIDINWALTARLMDEAKRLGLTVNQATAMARWFGRLTPEERDALVEAERLRQETERRRR